MQVAMPVPVTGVGQDMSTGPALTAAPAITALARFEFEAGRGNEGTKILMVEWATAALMTEASSGSKNNNSTRGDWEVSWKGKKTTISNTTQYENGGEESNVDDMDATTQRVYFLLPSFTPVPPVIKITHHPTGQWLDVKTMPAIFAPGMGIDAYRRDVGKRGVLHTIWAKKRLSQLEVEIRNEMRDNVESVGLIMAMQEKEWITENFLGPSEDDNDASGARDKEGRDDDEKPVKPSIATNAGGRLGEKLRGLKLATGVAHLGSFVGGPGSASGQPSHMLYTVSPEPSDVAVPSRSAILMSTGGSNGAFGQLMAGVGGGIGSLNALVSGGDESSAQQGAGETGKGDDDDELFAVPMSPRG